MYTLQEMIRTAVQWFAIGFALSNVIFACLLDSGEKHRPKWWKKGDRSDEWLYGDSRKRRDKHRSNRDDK